MAVIAELQRTVETMPIASHFNRTTDPEEIDGRLGGNQNFTPNTVQAVEQTGEAGLKRAQLTADLNNIQNRLLELTAGLQRVVIDIAATKTE